jgi:hypothetical protein
LDIFSEFLRISFTKNRFSIVFKQDEIMDATITNFQDLSTVCIASGIFALIFHYLK